MSAQELVAVLSIMDQASRPLKQIQGQSEDTAQTLKKLDQVFDQLDRSMNPRNASRFNASQQETRARLQAVKVIAEGLSSSYHKLASTMTIVSRKSAEWSSRLEQSRQSMRSQALQMGLQGYLAGKGFAAFLKPAVDFEQQMSRVQAVLDLDKTSTDMQKLLADARKQGAASSFSPTEAAQAQHALASGGFSTQQILDSLKGTLQLAEAGQVELARAAQIAVGTLNGFGLEAKEITRVNDILLRATDLTATSVDGFGETMKYVAPIAKAYGASIEETSAMIGLLGNNNILDSQAGTSLRSIMTRFAAPPTEAAKVMKKLNMTFSDSKGNLRDMSDIFKEINEKTKNLGEAGRLEVFKKLGGQEAISAFAVLVDQSTVLDKNTGQTVNKIKEMTNQLENSQGAAAKAAAILKDNLAGDFEQLTGSVQDLSISFLNVVGADLRGLVTRLTEIIDRVKIWVDANPELVRTIGKLVFYLISFKVAMFSAKYSMSILFGSIFAAIAALTKLGIAIFIIKKIAAKFGFNLPSRIQIITKVMQLLSRVFLFLAKKALPLIIAGLRALAITLLTNPITWIITAIALVAFLIYKYWGPIKAFFKGFWDGLKIGLAPMMDTLRTAFNNLKTTLEPLRPLWDMLVGAWQTFKGVLAEILSPMQATNQELQNATNYGQTLGQFLGVLIGILVEALVTIGTFLGETAAKVVLFVQDCMAAWEDFKIAVVSVGTTLINHLLAPINSIIGAVNTLINTINKIPFINIPNIPTIPQVGTAAATTTAAQKVPTTTVKPTTTIPFKAAVPANVTNNYAAANINISGVTDPKAVGVLVDQKLRQHEQMLASQKNRTYSDLA
ncbi:phage tail tape measure protein [Acinetobacter defluvii]|uniref:phage tail tape measure protein n=1 Tax=Acinetobacter defluvii TaxID=1871111 RepID=UPI00148FAD87|nr:phage tail tape measure protein [Acinetobacter defluvii]NNP73914.1 phage tail tape measure protein [Acinetobacter defluvii]